VLLRPPNANDWLLIYDGWRWMTKGAMTLSALALLISSRPVLDKPRAVAVLRMMIELPAH
jgi:hypothetical protein